MIHSHPDDTICAIATSASAGGIGIVRVSGANCRKIIETVARLSGQKLKAQTLHYTNFYDAAGKIVDDGYLAWMPGPNSYTAEDCAEFQAHGGATNLRRLLAVVVAAGSRPAERGEFTLRAFLNGRIDLSQAEAVLDIIEAPTETALDIAHHQLRGGLSHQINSIRDTLATTLALLEAQIDFVEEDLDDKHSSRPTKALENALARLQDIASTFHRGKILRSGVRVVLVGAPNAGKSSLFNALLKTNRAIVTHIPGTTRDFLEETVDFNGVPVTLVDTAGMHTSTDAVEVEGMERSVAMAATANLVLALTDATDKTPFDVDLPIDPSLVLRVKTKADLAPGDVSVVTGVGIEELVARIRTRVLPENSDTADTAIITSTRHFDAVTKANIALESAVHSSRTEAPEITAVEIQEALHQLGLVVGETSTEDILDRIFSTFCIGK